MSDIEITKVVCGEYASNAYIARKKGADECVLIDAGDDYALLKRELERLRVRPSHALLTHGHFDHVLSAERLRADYGTRVLIHSSDASALSNPEICLLPAHLSDAFKPVKPDAFLDSGEASFGGLDFTVIHTPGHSPGCVCLLLAGEKALFTGDTLFENGFGRTDLLGGDWAKLYGSIKKLLALDDDITVYPGHGSGGLLKNIKERFKR